MQLDPKIWGPHYWFVLHTISYNYPLNPNEFIKKKYYDFIQNLPLFIPNNNMANQLIKILDEFPVTPYLDSRESFIKWMYFIHNKINILIENPEISLEKSMKDYFNFYKKEVIINKEILISNKKIISLLILFVLIIIVYLYR